VARTPSALAFAAPAPLKGMGENSSGSYGPLSREQDMPSSAADATPQRDELPNPAALRRALHGSCDRAWMND